jgi:hypothetical protein
MKQLVFSNYTEFAIQPKCNVVSFMNPRDRQSELLFPTLFELADIFQHEPDVAFGMINCSSNISFCFSLGIRLAPIVRVYKGTDIWDFTGTRELDPLLEFINSKCGKRRADDGGFAVRKPSPEFKDAFARFLDATDKELFLRDFEGGEVEAKVLARIAKNGIGIVEKDITTCENVITSPDVNGEARSIVQEQRLVLLACRDVLAQRADTKEL